MLTKLTKMVIWSFLLSIQCVQCKSLGDGIFEHIRGTHAVMIVILPLGFTVTIVLMVLLCGGCDDCTGEVGSETHPASRGNKNNITDQVKYTPDSHSTYSLTSTSDLKYSLYQTDDAFSNKGSQAQVRIAQRSQAQVRISQRDLSDNASDFEGFT